MTKVDIFSGFLGAGKTTLIKKLISDGYNGCKLVLIENEFGQIGIPAIADPGCGNYKTGDSFQLVMTLPVGRTPDSLAWRFDGTDKTGAKSVTLTAGDHHVTAVVKWPEGETETFDLQIHVQ